MKIALVCYHKNAEKLYPNSWIQEFRKSVLNQTIKDFDIFEIEYGGGEYRIFENSFFESIPFPTFVHALNYLLNKIISLGYDCAFNLNVDDSYALNRIEKQLPLIEHGYDIVSSNFSLLQDGATIKVHSFENLDIALELSNNHNLLCHPVIAYSKNFLMNNKYVPEQQPMEDLMLWQRSIKNGYRFIILPETLCFHRLHSNSVCQSENK